MSRTSRTRSHGHRSRKKRLALMVLAPVAAVAAGVALMNSAGAATPSEVSADCKSDSDKLENCEFVDVQFKQNSLGPNERVSGISNNCGNTTGTTKSFNVSASVTRTTQLEEGFISDSGIKLGNSLFEIGAKFQTKEVNITRDDKKTTLAFERSDTVQPDHIGFFMWSHKRTDVSGFLKATYKEAQDGRTVFFSPSEGSTAIHVFYPQILKNGTPDGRLWLRNVKCGTPEASALLNSSGGASPQGVGDGAEDLRAEPGFGEGGDNVTDLEIPVSEIPAP
ncbi:hypothetical protein OHS71_23340 [Streptomyces sp. NBC_00377]|uniref:hypothetical protein n=1 Tax=unclassified Streptomyces TaxID=2593676 RepID=UPI002E1E6566|nr:MULTISPECIES: hypothetical protein [unclassified Streptomyces]